MIIIIIIIIIIFVLGFEELQWSSYVIKIQIKVSSARSDTVDLNPETQS
jgi:hypothetical protein